MAGTNQSGQRIDIHYAVIAYPGGGNVSQGHGTINDITAVTSHEMAEAVTDPNVNYKALGWYDDTFNHGQGAEIGDISQNSLATVKNPANGASYLVQLSVGINDQVLPLVTTPPVVTPPVVTPPVVTPPVTTPVTPTLPLTPSSNHVSAGQSLTLTITVSSGSGSTGAVKLYDGNVYIGSTTVGANGKSVVTLVTGRSSSGVHKITARFNDQTSSFNLTIDPVLQPRHLPWWL